MSSRKAYCAACGEVIGVYEPAVLVTSSAGAIRASGLTLDGTQEGMALHEVCYERADPAASAPPR